ncbi:hypothetical protein [Moorena sp. SIO3B2]|uniref:hypothetical protein n=1 Tax=Moorena sp. SIO3B2 TaxID=2607827 RepID=UPI0013CC4D69|nr:hypothetical protein [Moorena sp. SIO3B2]NEP35784.1 hypothetical protein [Moorena sp. SIO3B2]
MNNRLRQFYQFFFAECSLSYIGGIAESRNEYEWGGHSACPKISGTGKMPILQTLKIIPLLSNAKKTLYVE